MVAPGTRFGPYEILAPLGAGGMGEVYRARDTRLGRTVALKVLPAELARDPERVSRFEREARSASSLSHAHVVAVYDVGRQGDESYLVTEIVEGGNVRDLLERGAIPIRRAMDIAIQIASGLAAAHEQGIVHRDLKPENVLLTKQGESKIGDFGLAKLTEPGDDSNSALPTSDGLRTSDGMVMGTVAYMSPEQASGRSVDFRSDQFAFGAILYELLSGRSAFRRPSPAETLSAVMRDEPEPVQAIRPDVPAPLAWILDRCLAKEPVGRYASTRDLATELATVRDHLSDVTGRASGPPARGVVAGPAGTQGHRAAWAIAGLAVLAGMGLALVVRGRTRPPSPVIRFTVPPPEGMTIDSDVEFVSMALSPDGDRLAFVAHRPLSPPMVWIRTMSDFDARPIAGSEGVSSLCWSPDGNSLAFFAGHLLKRLDLAGGSAVPICELPTGEGRAASWGDGLILYATVMGEAIYRVSTDGGRPEVLIRPDPARGETRTAWPSFLPDGRHFLYTALHKGGESLLMVGALDGTVRTVAPIPSRVEFAEPGFVVYAREGALVGQRFDARSAKLAGPLFSLAPAVRYFYSTRWASFAVSRSGSLAFQPQGNVDRLEWFDRSGRTLGTLSSAIPSAILDVAISPDSRTALFSRERPDLGTYDIWQIDLARGTETRVTSDPETEFGPVWLPDGKSIVYSVVRNGRPPNLVRRSYPGEREEPLLPADSFQAVRDIAPDGRQLIFWSRSGSGKSGLSTLSLAGGGQPVPLPSSFVEDEARFSPDGRSVALISNESGQMEAYVVSLGPGKERIRLSTGGAESLRWSRNGKEIYYTSPDRKLYAVPVTVSPALEAGTPSALFSLPEGGWTTFDVASDGRFLAGVRTVSGARAPLSVVSNGFSEIRP